MRESGNGQARWMLYPAHLPHAQYLQCNANGDSGVSCATFQSVLGAISLLTFDEGSNVDTPFDIALVASRAHLPILGVAAELEPLGSGQVA